MKTTAITIRLEADQERLLNRCARRSGRSRSEVVREALRRQLAIARFRELRQGVMPLAEDLGIGS